MHLVYNHLYSNQSQCKFFLYKEIMEKIPFLPKITIRQMENKVKELRTTHKKYIGEEISTENDKKHHSDITVISPFYERTHHKEKCECQYHRMKRATQANKKVGRRKQKTIDQESTKEVKQMKENQRTIELLTNRVSQPSYLSLSKTLDPMQANFPIKIPQSSQNQKITIKHSTILNNLPSRKTIAKCKASGDQAVNSRIDAMNHEYIQLISHRLQNQKFKEKYLKTLFGFIKMKSNQNSMYMYNSRAYIHNSLNKLLNHYSLKQLLEYQQLAEEQIQSIAHHMSCFPQKVRDVLLHLRKAVSQMEKTLAEIKTKRKLNMINEEGNENINMTTSASSSKQDLSNYLNNEINAKDKGRTKNDLDNMKQIDDSCNQSKARHITQIEDNNRSLVNIYSNLQSNIESLSHQNSQKENTQRERQSIQKPSSKKLKDLPSNTSLKNQPSENKPTVPNQHTKNARKSIRVSRNSQNLNGQQMNRRSFRSTIRGIADQLQKETRFKSKRSTKLKKTKIKSRESYLDQKYSGVPYQKYMTKKKFQFIVNQIEKPGQDDNQIAVLLFSQLNVESFFEDQRRMEEILNAFRPLFNEQSLRLFLKQVVARRDRRYIEKLERELDDMLQQIKKNDPRMADLDFFQPKPFKKIAQCPRKLTNHHQQFNHEKQQKIGRIKYYEAEQQIQRHKFKQRSKKMNLEQIQMRAIRFDTIDPSRSTVITHSQSPNKQLLCSPSSPNLIDAQAQKKILRYMKSKHEGIFNYLTSQFEALCRSLSKEDIV